MHSKPIALSTFACVTVAFLIASAVAQESKTSVSMFCSTSAGGPGFVLVKLSNLTSLDIPKGETLFAKKGGKTIEFKAAEAIPAGGSVTQRTSEEAFQFEGNCDGWH
ncbi:MAG: hypothetical protein WBW99_07360 [Pseudolabrys sp.]